MNLEAEHEASDPIKRAERFLNATGWPPEATAHTPVLLRTLAAFAESENAQLLAETLRLRQEVERLESEIDQTRQVLESSHIQNNKHRMGLCGAEDVDNAIERLKLALGQQVEA